MNGPTSSYVAVGIAFEFVGGHKPPQSTTKCFRQGGDFIKGGDDDDDNNKNPIIYFSVPHQPLITVSCFYFI
jgi:hypothetical protein